MIRNFEVFAQVVQFGGGVHLWLHQAHDPSGNRAIMQPINPEIRVEQYESATSMIEPTLILGREQAVTFMTALWKVGVRPQGVQGDETEMVAALKARIESLEVLLARASDHDKQLVELLKGAQEIIVDGRRT